MIAILSQQTKKLKNAQKNIADLPNTFYLCTNSLCSI